MKQCLKKLVAARIKAELARQGIGQNAFGRSLGMASSTVCVMLSGKHGLSFENLGRVADALGLEPWELFTEPQPKKRGKK